MSYIAIVDYGAGNLMSVHNTLDYLGYENKIAASADVIENAAGVILPGVGAFPDAMAALTDSGLTEAVLKAAGVWVCCRDALSALRRVSSCRRSAGMRWTFCVRMP